MSKQFNPKYLIDCIEHALERCQQVTSIRRDLTRLIRGAFQHSHETSTPRCRELRKQFQEQVSRLRALESWEKYLLAAAMGLLMPQPAMKINHVLPQCRLALDELETRFYAKYHGPALNEAENGDWRYKYSWISQEGDWQRQHALAVPSFAEVK